MCRVNPFECRDDEGVFEERIDKQDLIHSPPAGKADKRSLYGI